MTKLAQGWLLMHAIQCIIMAKRSLLQHAHMCRYPKIASACMPSYYCKLRAPGAGVCTYKTRLPL